MTAALSLWKREMTRFFRQPSRVAGALLQPLIVWAIAALGFSGIFHFPGVDQLQASQFFFPGIVVMVLLFNAIFSTISVIEDRQTGFLQAALAGPSARAAIAMGKLLASLSLALAQCGIFLALSPLAGFDLSVTDWPRLIAALVLSGAACTFLGLLMAWRMQTSGAYHALMSVFLLPGWFLSGAMFPLPETQPWSLILRLNPFAWMVDGTRAAIYGGELPDGLAAVMLSPDRSLLLLLLFVLIIGGMVLRLIGGRRG